LPACSASPSSLRGRRCPPSATRNSRTRNFFFSVDPIKDAEREGAVRIAAILKDKFGGESSGFGFVMLSPALVSAPQSCYHKPVNIKDTLAKISATQAPLTRQLLMTGLISRLLTDKGKPAPVLIGGLALSYYTREVYFTADIDLAYSDREALDEVLGELGFVKKGRYWIHAGLDIAVEAPTSGLAGENAPTETAELEGDLFCVIIGLEDLIIDRINACKHWRSEVDCEMTELLIARYGKEIDWTYLERKAGLPENDTLAELRALRAKGVS